MLLSCGKCRIHCFWICSIGTKCQDVSISAALIPAVLLLNASLTAQTSQLCGSALLNLWSAPETKPQSFSHKPNCKLLPAKVLLWDKTNHTWDTMVYPVKACTTWKTHRQCSYSLVSAAHHPLI